MENNQQNQQGSQGQNMQSSMQGQNMQGQQNMQGEQGMQGQQGMQAQQGIQAQQGMQGQGEQRDQGAMQSSGAQGMTAERRPGMDGGVLRPPVDVIEDMSGITLVADMPGVSKDDLHLRLASQSLTIAGKLSIPMPQEMESRYAEVRHQQYERTFALSRELDGEKATAQLANGVLTIRIPKTAEASPRKIPVNVAS